LTASRTAVDNVLERFLRLNEKLQLLPTHRIVRFATERSRVSRALQHLTLEGHVGGEIVRDKARRERAEKLLRRAAVVFTTCASAGLGALRQLDGFDTVLIDEASQVTEPIALIPLVKGCTRAVLVGDQCASFPFWGPGAWGSPDSATASSSDQWCARLATRCYTTFHFSSACTPVQPSLGSHARCLT
jgi:hypothetical protein